MQRMAAWTVGLGTLGIGVLLGFWGVLRADDARGFVKPPPSNLRPHTVTRIGLIEVTDPETGETRQVRRPVTETYYSEYPESLPTETNSFMQRYRTATDEEERLEIAEEFREHLSGAFDQLHQKQADEIAAIEDRLKKAKANHELRFEKKDEIIQRRLEKLTGLPSQLDWFPPSFEPSSESNRIGFDAERSSSRGIQGFGDSFEPLTPRSVPSDRFVPLKPAAADVGERYDRTRNP